ALDLITYTVTENNNIVLEQNRYILEPFQLNNKKLEISLIIDLLNINFGRQDSTEVFQLIVENSNMKFDSIIIVESKVQNANKNL
ncbi:4585_t:CDS:1, partial [Racocetra fulgida]